MTALQIQDVKDFMSRLLIGNDFDNFWLYEASITTFSTFTIDGTLHTDFFDTEESRKIIETGRTCALWKEVKPFCFSIIKGKRTPLHFKIIFQLSRKNTEKLLLDSNSRWRPEEIFGLYLNLQYDGSSLICTTGTSIRTFTMDKSLDRIWDEMVIRFFKKQQITSETL
ncbi:MAG: DUF5721 family protein [Blautia sp.]